MKRIEAFRDGIGETLPVLVVDDDEVVRLTLSRILEKEGYQVEAIEEPEEGLRRIEERDYLTVITDVIMPGMSGLEFQRRLRERRAELPVVVISSFPTIERIIEAVQGGAVDFLTKPFDMDQILRVVKRCAEARVELARNLTTQQFMKNDIHMRIPSTAEHIQGAVHFITRRSMLADAYSTPVAFQVRLALDEAMANALEHGNKNLPDKLITVVVSITALRFDVTVEDEGSGFDPASVVDPMSENSLSSLLEGGRGLFLMRCYMDGVEFNGSGNSVHMWKENRSLLDISAQGQEA